MNHDDETEFDKQLMARARDLPKSIEPERDLWPAIEAAVRQPREPAFRWQSLVAQAAAVVLLVGGSSTVTWLAVKDDGSSVSPVAVNGLNSLSVKPTEFGARYTLGPGFQDAREGLESRVEQELERLSPEAREEVAKNLVTIRRAITEINKALAEEPENVLLQELLLNTYREELAVMRNVDGITRSVMLREDI